MGWGRKRGMLNCTFPLLTDCSGRGLSFSCLELWAEGLRRVEVSLVLGNKGLWSYSFPRPQRVEWGLCWWGLKYLWVLANCLESQLLLGDGAAVGKSRTGALPPPQSSLPLTGKNGIRCLGELGVAPGEGVGWVCVLCLGAGSPKGYPQ